MIASFSNGFVFVKTRKTGGTSVEIVLSTWCSGNDICTPITGSDELIRRSYGGRPMNFCDDANLARLYLEAFETGNSDMIDASYREIRPHLRFRNHDPASKLRDSLPELWPGAFKFTVDRHPYEKVVSLVYWRIARRKGGDVSRFEDTLDEVLEARQFVNFPLYMEGDKLLVDAVLKHDDMWDEISALATRLNVQMPSTIPSAKAQHRHDPRPADEILRSDSKARIREACAAEFELIGWSA